jgi:hypothetical protein
MRTDPEPGDYFAFTQTKRRIMLTDTNDANPVTALFKMERRMIWVPSPDCVLFAGQFLDGRR